MTTKVTKKHSPAEHQSPQKYHSLQTLPSGVCISLQAITLHPQPRYLSPAGGVSTIPFSPAAVVSGLGTWSDSAPEETYTSYTSARDYNGPKILLTRSPSSYQMLSDKIYT